MHRKSMEVAQHYGTNDSSEPESSSDYTEIPKKTQQQQPNNNNLTHPVTTASDFAVAAAAAAAAMTSEDFRSHSIAALRARAQQHSEALIHHGRDPLHGWTPPKMESS